MISALKLQVYGFCTVANLDYHCIVWYRTTVLLLVESRNEHCRLSLLTIN